MKLGGASRARSGMAPRPIRRRADPSRPSPSA
jgi:hypothetical protein